MLQYFGLFQTFLFFFILYKSLGSKLFNNLPGRYKMKGPSLLSIGYDLRGREDEAVVPSVPKLDAVHIGDARNAQGPVQGGAGGRVEDTRNASGLINLAMGIVQGVIASVGQIKHFIIS